MTRPLSALVHHRPTLKTYERLADATNQNLKSLMGRHLMQRRGLYARALKTNDVRTALLVLKDEALLEGIYPAMKISASANEELYPHSYEAGPLLSKEERFKRFLAAEERDDQEELRLLEQVTPVRTLRIGDTMMPKLMLDMCALMYVGEQLDHASMVFLAGIEYARYPERDGWQFIADVHGYRFKIGMDGWEMFTESLGIDGLKLVKANHFGSALELFSDRLYEMAPTKEQMVELLIAQGESPDKVPTAERSAKEWRDLLNRVLRS